MNGAPDPGSTAIYFNHLISHDYLLYTWYGTKIKGVTEKTRYLIANKYRSFKIE